MRRPVRSGRPASAPPLAVAPPLAAALALAAALLLAASCKAPMEDERADRGQGRMPSRVALDLDAIERTGVIGIDVGEDAVSLLLELALEDGEHGIGIVRVTAPDGTVVHDSPFEADSWETTSFASEILAESAVGIGDLALSLPATPDRPLASGRWLIQLETDPPDAPFVTASATVRDAPDGVVDEGTPHVVDLHVHVIHPDERYRGDGFPEAFDTDWRAALERVLAPHALGIGTMTVSVASRRETARLAELDDDREIASACRAIRRAGRVRSAASGEVPGRDVPALHVGLVATITGEAVSDEGWPDDPDERGDPDGGEAPLTGLSPQPGLPWYEESPNACAFVAERPWREGYAEGEELDESTIVELLAANLLHELGHFAGLAHPSEADGETFDLLGDTPRCPEPDPEVCGVEGGADNLMFLSGDERTLPWTLTPDQAWVLRRHVLFRPDPGDGGER